MVCTKNGSSILDYSYYWMWVCMCYSWSVFVAVLTMLLVSSWQISSDTSILKLENITTDTSLPPSQTTKEAPLYTILLCEILAQQYWKFEIFKICQLKFDLLHSHDVTSYTSSPSYYSKGFYNFCLLAVWWIWYTVQTPNVAHGIKGRLLMYIQIKYNVN